MILFITQDSPGISDIKLVGSANDGFGFFASIGSNKHLLQRKSVLTQDIDLNIFLNTIQVTEENLIPCAGGPGFTWIRLSQVQVSVGQLHVGQYYLLWANSKITAQRFHLLHQ